MAIAKGSKGRLLIDFETTYGQDPSTKNAILVPFNSESINASQNLIEPNTIRGNLNKVAPIRGNLDVGGDITVPLDLINIGYWLKALLNSPDTTGTDDGAGGTTAPYTHVFKIPDEIPSLVVEKGFTDIGQYFKFNGVKVSSFRLDFGGDGELTAGISVVGKDVANSTISYSDSPTEEQFIRFNNFQATVLVDGSEENSVTAGSINISTNLDTSIYSIASGGKRGELPVGLFDANGTLTVYFQDMTLLNKAINGEECSLKVKFEIDASKSLEFYFPEVIFERKTPEVSGPAGIQVDLNWRAYFDDNSEETSVKVTLVNDKASY